MKNTLKAQKLKKLPQILALFATMALFCTSCTEDEGDVVSPEVVLSSPSEGAVFAANEVIELVGRATDDVALQTVNISSNLGVNEDLTSFDDPQDFPFNINLTLEATTPPGEYTITFTATDTSGNTGDVEVNVEIQ